MKEIIVYIQVADARNLPESTESLPQIQIIIDGECPSRNRIIGIEFLTSAIITAAENLELRRAGEVVLKARLWSAVELGSPGSSQRRRTTTTEGGVI